MAPVWRSVLAAAVGFPVLDATRLGAEEDATLLEEGGNEKTAQIAQLVRQHDEMVQKQKALQAKLHALREAQVVAREAARSSEFAVVGKHSSELSEDATLAEETVGLEKPVASLPPVFPSSASSLAEEAASSVSVAASLLETTASHVEAARQKVRQQEQVAETARQALVSAKQELQKAEAEHLAAKASVQTGAESADSKDETSLDDTMEQIHAAEARAAALRVELADKMKAKELRRREAEKKRQEEAAKAAAEEQARAAAKAKKAEQLKLARQRAAEAKATEEIMQRELEDAELEASKD